MKKHFCPEVAVVYRDGLRRVIHPMYHYISEEDLGYLYSKYLGYAFGLMRIRQPEGPRDPGGITIPREHVYLVVTFPPREKN